MCDDTQCYVLAGLGLAAISLPLPLGLIAGIGWGRGLRRWEWPIGATLVVAAAPASFLFTAYFFIGLPFVAVVALLAALAARSARRARVLLIAPLAFYVGWWLVAGAWALTCPSCGEGDAERSYVWGVGGLMLASPLALLLLTLEFGRVGLGRLLYRRTATIAPGADVNLVEFR